MSYGFQILRPNGTVVIDDQSFNYTVKSSDNSSSFPVPPFFVGGPRGPIPQEADELLFCELGVGEDIFSGNTPGGFCITANRNFVRARPYYSEVLPNYGMAVFNPAGVATFHTGEPLVQVLSTHSQFLDTNQIPAVGGPVNIDNVSIPAETTHFAIVSGTNAIQPLFPPPSTQMLVEGTYLERTSNTNVLIKIAGIGAADLALLNRSPLPVTLSFITARII